MAVIYNPKTFTGKVNSPPQPSQPVSMLWDGKYWKVGVNQLVKVPEHIGKEMLKRYGFLEEVKPENLEHIKERMANKQFVCEHCKAEFGDEKALKGHMLGKHKLSKENEAFFSDIPEANVEEYRPKKGPTPEEASGINMQDPSWVGPGLEDDTETDMKVKRGVGTF